MKKYIVSNSDINLLCTETELNLLNTVSVNFSGEKLENINHITIKLKQNESKRFKGRI